MTTNEHSPQPFLPPPDPPGPAKWIRDNLFGSLLNTFLTTLSVAITSLFLYISIQWLKSADWSPVTESPMLYVVGSYPRDQVWRVGIGLSLTMFLLGLSAGKWKGLIRSIALLAMIAYTGIALLPVQHPQLSSSMRLYLGGNVLVIALGYLASRLKSIKPAMIAASWVLAPLIIMVLFSGFENSELFEKVVTTSWGGLMVTFLLAFGGILLSFPIGVLLALGRRSSLIMVRIFSTMFIEGVRGVPLVTILFMFSVILALFLPEETRLDRLMRALMALTFFSSAYMAENIRGGLQAVPIGQIEAAKAVGMSNFHTMVLIVLPQAIRTVIPAIVGQFIGLFKDTTLVLIVGINDLLGIAKSILSGNSAYLLLQTEVYIFIAAIYWIFSYFMSLGSRRVETALGVGQR